MNDKDSSPADDTDDGAAVAAVDTSGSGKHQWLISIGVLLAGIGLLGVGASTVLHHDGPGGRSDRGGMMGGANGQGGGMMGGHGHGDDRGGNTDGPDGGGFGGGRQGNVVPNGMGGSGATPATPTAPGDAPAPTPALPAK